MGFVHSDPTSSDSEEDAPEPTNGLSNSSDVSAEHQPQSPSAPLRSAPLRGIQPSLQYQPSPRPVSPSQPSQTNRIPQRYQEEYDEDEDEDDASPQSNRYPSPPPPPLQTNHLKLRINTKAFQPPPQSPTPTPKPAPAQSSQSTTSSTTSEPHKPTRKRARPEKTEQANPDPDAPPKPKPAAITFIPKQHYSRSDIHDCLGGQRFCAISTPSAYPFILIFAHYQPYVGEDGMWEHCASGDLNKGVNRSVIHAKERKKRLLLFFSMAGQQGAVYFLGEVKYVSSEQKEEKNSKGVDKACVIFKFQCLNNDAITINLFDFTKPEIMVSQPKPVIRSLTEDPNTYYLDSTYTSTVSDMNPNTTSFNNSNITNSITTSSITTNNVLNYNMPNNNMPNNNMPNNNVPNNNVPNNNIPNNMRRSLVSSTSSDGVASSDTTAIMVSSPSASPILSSSSTISATSASIISPISHSQNSFLPIKKERTGKEDAEHSPTTSSLHNSFASFSNTITNLSRTSISKLTNDSPLPNITRMSADRRGEDGWNFVTNSVPVIPTTGIIPTSDTRTTESPDSNAPFVTPTVESYNSNTINNSTTNDNSTHYYNYGDTLTSKDDFVVPSTSTQGSPSPIPATEPAPIDTN